MKNALHTHTELLGLIGHPIKHTFSPMMHNVASQLLDLDYLYLPFDISHADLSEGIAGLKVLGFKGFNVTVPHKEAIFSLLDTVSEEAVIIGAVNCVVNDGGTLHGYNTDAFGVHYVLDTYREEITGSPVMIFGAGGASRSAVYTLIRHYRPSVIHIVNRTIQRAEQIALHFKQQMHYDGIVAHEQEPVTTDNIMKSCKLIINTTTLGMTPLTEDSPVSSAAGFTDNQIVFDMVYNPVNTQFLQMAESQGAITVGGIKMLVAQGAKSFELWTGKQMPVNEIYDTLLKYLNP
ncbi:MAG: shikimate dehydrogenase [Ignavibacteriales bacterium]|nr:Shikimate dehydrogenase (NADP(+)) [Ignavibacteriaceae bacterium]MCK6612604.1 shikimate dehydrogenase [Ignavibacteriaceae bacterium]QOJ29658.1 MAG: shikimate dehydrogenase [Ignavibacteriales bacterium]